MLKEVNENYKRVEGLAGYVHWVSTAEELSDESLKEAYEETGNECKMCIRDSFIGVS